MTVKAKPSNALEKSEPGIEWRPIIGNWKFENGSPVYTGHDPSGNLYGIVRQPEKIRNGHISVTVESDFKSGDDIAARILLGFKDRNSPYVTAGIGGYGNAYVISEFSPHTQWHPSKTEGNKSYLEDCGEFTIEVSIEGQHLAMSVNDNEVLDHVLSSPLASNSAGLFAWGKSEIRFTEFKIHSKSPKCFVIMQFREPYNSLYENVIKPLARHMGYETVRADEIFQPGLIIRDIEKQIVEADVIVAEITPENANVYYELGYAHALRKPVILLADKDFKPPFDISPFRRIIYENSIRGKQIVEDELKKHFTNMNNGN